MAVLFLVLVMLINVAVNFAATGPPYCWDFNNVSMNGWTGTGFTSSLYEGPYIYEIPKWFPPADYVYVQSTSTGKTGELTMPITINDGDVISARLYRHLVEYDGTVRISLSFATEGVTRTLLTNPYYDSWDVEQITCGVGYFTCCIYYPCDGELFIDGSVLTIDELVGVDYVAINSGCGYVPPPPPLLNGPYDCNFDSSVCYWSIARNSSGWHWSYYEGNPDAAKHPNFSIPPTPYIWVEDTSASITSDVIFGVTSSTVFYFDYYFDTSVPGSDYFDVAFYDINDHTSTILNPVVSNSSGNWMYSQAFENVVYVCQGASSCTGQIQITTLNTPYQKLLLAVDNFMVSF